jgi:DNA-binding winged helix-turn-helix (wHTH) protein
MSEQGRQVYSFGTFVLDAEERFLLKDGMPVQLPPKAFDLLVVLVRNGGRLVKKDDLMEAVWPGVTVEESNIPLNVHTLRKALDDNAGSPQFIETVPKQGYRFIAPVQELRKAVEKPIAVRPLSEEGEASSDNSGSAASGSKAVQDWDGKLLPPREDTSLHLPRPSGMLPKKLSSYFGGHLWHVLASCTLYALLYTVALFVEIAYQYDLLGPAAWKVAPWVFLWIMITSAAGMGADWKWTRRGEATGVILSLLIFIAAGVLLYAALGMLLPNTPITEAKFQTYTAHGAYLKSVYYFLPLAVFFLILPFHFVLSTQRDLQAGRRSLALAALFGKRVGATLGDAIYLRVGWLALALVVAALVSLGVLAHLFENLLPNMHINLFIQSVQWRTLLYFALGLECLAWYYYSLGRIRRRCMGVMA